MFNRTQINIAYTSVLVYDIDNTPLYFDCNISNIDILNDSNPIFGYRKDIVNIIQNEFNISFPYKIDYDTPLELRQRLLALDKPNILKILDPAYNVFRVGIVDDFIKRNENFIYPIYVANNDIFTKYSTIDLPNNLINYIKTGKAKLLFAYFMEGNFGIDERHLNWVSNLSSKYDLKKDEIIIVTSNMIIDEVYTALVSNNKIKDNFTVYPFSWFSYNVYPHSGVGNCWKLDLVSKESYYKSLYYFLQKNRTEQKKHHFLCFNRLPKYHRICVYGELKTNPKFKGKYIATIGNRDLGGSFLFVDQVNLFLRDDYKHSKQKLLNFFSSFDDSSHHIYDCDDMQNNKASVMNRDAHSSSFVNIVTESLLDSNCVFFSEKMFKPIYAAQPFILVGNPYSLKKLKEMGYQTFDKWWDESYDNEIDFTRRLEKIVDVMEYISSWSLEKCFQVTNEMESVLVNNFNVLVSDTETIKFYNFLNSGGFFNIQRKKII